MICIQLYLPVYQPRTLENLLILFLQVVISHVGTIKLVLFIDQAESLSDKLEQESVSIDQGSSK